MSGSLLDTWIPYVSAIKIRVPFPDAWVRGVRRWDLRRIASSIDIQFLSELKREASLLSLLELPPTFGAEVEN